MEACLVGSAMCIRDSLRTCFFMSDQNKIADPIEYVSKNTDIVMCDGGSGDLGHPAVYFKFGKKKEIVCNYCNKKFIKKD